MQHACSLHGHLSWGGTKRVWHLPCTDSCWRLLAGFAKRFAFVSAHDALLITVKWTRAAQMGPTDTHVKFGGSSTLPHFNYRILWLSLQMDKIITSSDNFGDWPNNHNIQILSQANNHFAIYWVSSVWLLSREYQTQNHRLSFLPSFIVSRLQVKESKVDPVAATVEKT